MALLCQLSSECCLQALKCVGPGGVCIKVNVTGIGTGGGEFIKKVWWISEVS